MRDDAPPITVRELIALLSAVDPDLPVAHYYDGLCLVGTNSVRVVEEEFYTDQTDTVVRKLAVLSGPDGYDLNLWATGYRFEDA